MPGEATDKQDNDYAHTGGKGDVCVCDVQVSDTRAKSGKYCVLYAVIKVEGLWKGLRKDS